MVGGQQRSRWFVLVAIAALACGDPGSPGPVADLTAEREAEAATEDTEDTEDAAVSDAPGLVESQFDEPPADLKNTELVRCLVDTPEGCTGCDEGESCVYEQLSEYDCIYVVYGAKCDPAADAKSRGETE